LKIKGYDMIGESEREDLSDIDLHKIKRGIENNWESKNLCFKKGEIEEINYSHGNHEINPKGVIKLSDKVYINKHMCKLGIPYFTKKNQSRYIRCSDQRKKGMSRHYKAEVRDIKERYMDLYRKSKPLEFI
jgi:hypothetical protein